MLGMICPCAGTVEVKALQKLGEHCGVFLTWFPVKLLQKMYNYVF